MVLRGDNDNRIENELNLVLQKGIRFLETSSSSLLSSENEYDSNDQGDSSSSGGGDDDILDPNGISWMNETDETPSGIYIFWAVNGGILLVMFLLLLCCCRARGLTPRNAMVYIEEFVNDWATSRASGPLSDSWYISGVMMRREEEEERKKEKPEDRKKRLLAAFQKSGAVMVVTRGDLCTDSVPQNGEEDPELASNNNNDNTTATIASVGSSSSSDLPSTLLLPSSAKNNNNGNSSVPNCCAVCLCPYDEGDTVVWSTNPECQHAFHEDCIVEWLVKMQDGSPCPCCRQEFIVLSDLEEELRKKTGAHQRAFDVRTISL